VVVKVLRGRGREVSPWLYGIAALFALSFALGKG
jgi:xanthine/uracil/vitamin C permease (AzgA family)